MLQKSRVVFFLREPKRRRQLRHRRTGLGDFETGEKHKFLGIYSRHFIHFSKISTFQNVKIEILKCAWEQFPHVQKSRYGENRKSEKSRFLALTRPE